MSSESYNGWSNRATWLVNLWLLSDIDWDEFPEDMKTPEGLEDFCRECCEGAIPHLGLCADLFGFAWAHINWYELSEHYKEESI